MKEKNITISSINKNIGQCPENFDNDLAQIWENIKLICPDYTFELSDRIFLETMCYYVYSIKIGSRNLNQEVIKLLTSFMDKCMMPPKSRHELYKLINSNQ